MRLYKIDSSLNHKIYARIKDRWIKEITEILRKHKIYTKNRSKYLTSFGVEIDDTKWRNHKGNVDSYETEYLNYSKLLKSYNKKLKI